MDQKWDMEILSVEKFAERYEELFHRSFESSKLHYIRFCKAENWSQAVEGTFAIPQKEHLRGEKTAFGYCVLPNRFIFIEYETKIEPMLRDEGLSEYRCGISVAVSVQIYGISAGR